MVGYSTSYGYMGFVAGQWILFATENEYYEYLNDEGDSHKLCMNLATN